VNTAEAGKVLGKTAWWIRRQCASGELRASYYGSSWNVDPEAIDEYVDAHSNAPRTVAARRRPRRAS
jgi:hypothetical protein